MDDRDKWCERESEKSVQVVRFVDDDNVEDKIDKNQQNSKCRLYGD